MPDIILELFKQMGLAGAIGSAGGAIGWWLRRPRQNAELKQIKAQTGEAEANTYSLQIHSLTAMINEIQQERKEAKTKIENLQKDLLKVLAEREKDKQKIAWLDENLTKLLADAVLERASGVKLLEAERSENLRLRAKLDKVEARVAALEEALREETRQKMALQSRVDQLENTNNTTPNGTITTVEKTTTTTETKEMPK